MRVLGILVVVEPVMSFLDLVENTSKTTRRLGSGRSKLGSS
jgi:hypothetical protein